MREQEEKWGAEVSHSLMLRSNSIRLCSSSSSSTTWRQDFILMPTLASDSGNPLAASFKVLELQMCLQFFFALFTKEAWTWNTGDQLPLSRKRVVALGKAGHHQGLGGTLGYGAPPFLVRRGTLPELVSCLCRQTQPHLFSSRPSKWQLLPSTPPLWRWNRMGGLSWINHHIGMSSQ